MVFNATFLWLGQFQCDDIDHIEALISLWV